MGGFGGFGGFSGFGGMGRRRPQRGKDNIYPLKYGIEHKFQI